PGSGTRSPRAPAAKPPARLSAATQRGTAAMSNELAIACVTRTLRTLISDALKVPLPTDLPADVTPTGQILVTTLPLDKVRTVNANGNLINLYLYSTVPCPAFRNGLPPRGGAGSGGEQT